MIVTLSSICSSVESKDLAKLVKVEEVKALKINAHFAEAGSELRHIRRMMEQSDSGLRGLFGRKTLVDVRA